MKNHCRECDYPLQGRSDKKFCSSHCRSLYHMKLHRESTNFIRRVNAALMRNRRILASLSSEGEKAVSRELLLFQGYNFRYFTHATKAGPDRRKVFCYDYGYQDSPDGILILIEGFDNIE